MSDWANINPFIPQSTAVDNPLDMLQPDVDQPREPNLSYPVLTAGQDGFVWLESLDSFYSEHLAHTLQTIVTTGTNNSFLVTNVVGNAVQIGYSSPAPASSYAYHVIQLLEHRSMIKPGDTPIAPIRVGTLQVGPLELTFDPIGISSTSTSLSYGITATGLLTPVTLSASNNFQVSLDNVTFGTSAETVAPTSAWARFVSESNSGVYQGYITHNAFNVQGVAVILNASSTSEAPRDDWYSNYPYRVAIDYPLTSISGTVTAFPAPVKVDTVLGSGACALTSAAQSAGYDIMFTDWTGTNKIPHEFDLFLTGTGKFTAWVKVPSFSDSATSNRIYMYYGLSGTTATNEDSFNVWSNRYLRVYHFNQYNNSVSAMESTSAQAHGYFTGSYQNASGDVLGLSSNRGGVIESSGVAVIFPEFNYTVLNLGAGPLSAVVFGTWEVWRKRKSWVSAVNFEQFLFDKGMGLEDAGLSNKKMNFRSIRAGNGFVNPTDYNLVTTAVDRFSYIVHSFSANISGNQIAGGDTFFYYPGLTADPRGKGTSGNNPFWSSISTNFTSNSSTARLFGNAIGNINVDELRFSDVKRDIGWIKTNYNLVQDIATVTAGAIEAY